MTTLSGKQALERLDEALGQARGGLSRVDSEFGQARSALASVRQRQLGVYAGLAQLRLLDIEQGGLLESLDSADRDARHILDQRSAAVSRLEADIVAAEAALAADEEKRTAQQTVVASASEALDTAEADAQAKLAEDADYRQQFATTEQADFVADQAEAKAADARTDRIEKGKPYEDDPLFAYLWSRGYGTSRYRAGPIARFFDARVARLVDYEPARQNYALLTGIPERLAEHAAAMRAGFDREAGKLAALEAATAAAVGVPGRRDTLEAAEQQLAAIDSTIAERERTITSLVAQRKAFAAGEDEHYRHAIEVLSQAMQGQSIDFLRERAARTVHRDDDDLVQRLAELDAESDRIERNLSDYSRLHDRESERVGKLEDIRQRFKSKGFDDMLSEFKDAALIALILREFLRGAAGAGDVWKTIERQQRTRKVKADPHFGSLKFPKSPTRGPWRMPKSGGFGGGGFKTSGGFRGGGFKTGGKF